jgi:hypothetical protein
MEAVLTSEDNAADPVLKKRSVSRFIPDALVISSGGLWRERRRFNEGALDFDHRLHRHHDAFLQIVLRETSKMPRPSGGQLRWADFAALGERLSQQVILGAGQLKPVMGEQLASLVACSNLIFRDTVNYLAFHGEIEGCLARHAHNSLVGDSSSLIRGGITDDATRVPSQIGFWLYVLNDALALHVARTLALIAAHPQVEARARQEVVDAGELSAAAIDGLAYLEACIHEGLRLWTPVPLLLRRATGPGPFVLRGEIAIEPEQQILMHAGFYHRDARVFGDLADKFSPDEAVKPGFPDTYFFSAHRQSCVGRPLVTFLLKATLASMLVRYKDFKLRGPAIDPNAIPYLYDHFSVSLKT